MANDNGIPVGARQLTGIEVFTYLGELIILGTPPDEPDDLTPEEYGQWAATAHSCDQMDCGCSHVLYRFKLPV